ncbi:YceI family protein [soil metagenome]
MHPLRNCKWFLSLCLLFTTVVAGAQIQWKPSVATVSFKIKNAGFTVNGNFNGFAGQLSFDPNELAASSIHATVEVASISTGIASRDNHLKKDDYFDAAAYPKIDIASKTLYKKDNGFAGLFNVTIKNKKRQVEIPFTFTATGNTAIFNGSFFIDRRDYGVGGNSFIMGDNVTISIIVNAKR